MSALRRPRAAARAIAAQSALLIGDLDSTAQREAFDAAPTAADAVERLTGLLRTALLVSERVYVTDAMILDGAYFAELDPHDLGRELGMSSRRLPLVVLSRPVDGGADLERAFRDRFEDPGFVWQLRERGLDRAGIEEHAGRWIEAHRRGLFEVRPWGGEVVPPVRPGGFLTEGSAGRPPRGLSAAGAELAFEALGDARRSDLLSRTAVARAGGVVPDAEVDIVEEWWLAAYLRELALRNGAGWVRFSPEDPRQGAPLREPGDREDGVLALGGGVVTLVTEATPAAYGAMHYLVRAQRRAFQRTPTAWRLNALGFAAHEAMEGADRAALLRGAIVRAALASAAALLSVLVVEDAFALAVGAAVLAGTLPWQDLWQSVRLARLAPAARLKVHRLGD